MLILKYDPSYIAIKNQFFIFFINNKAPKSTPCLTPLSLRACTYGTDQQLVVPAIHRYGPTQRAVVCRDGTTL